MNSFDSFDYNTTLIPSPCYVVEESLLRKNLSLIQRISRLSGAEIIMAFKAFSMWKLFDITREYIPYSTASSLFEAKLAYYELQTKAHTFAPVYKESEIEDILNYSSHITFNSLNQYNKYKELAISKGVLCGLRINPEYSDVPTEIYNPCAPGSRFGIISTDLPEKLPEGITGLHFHTLCESNSYNLENTLKIVEEKFKKQLDQISWLNMGGGHLMTKEGYNIDHLISILQSFKQRHPNIHIILEPGSAHTWRTGVLVTTIQDIVCNHGIKTAIIDASFACHMPDCLEMPYQPYIIGAKNEIEENEKSNYFAYRIGGNSCLSGDFVGTWYFKKELQPNDRIVFEDMNHYTNVKTNMFNGITHPSIALRTLSGEIKILKEYFYEDYRDRMC